MKAGQFCGKYINKSLFLFVICAAVFLCGCAQERVWAKKGLNQNEFDQDLARCNREAASSTQIVGYAYGTDLERGLERSMAKENLIKKCMYSKGYAIESK